MIICTGAKIYNYNFSLFVIWKDRENNISVAVSCRMLLVSDWRSRKDSSTGSVDPETLSESDESSAKEESSEKDEKPPMKDSKKAQRSLGTPNLFSVSKPSASGDQARSFQHSTPKFGIGKLSVVCQSMMQEK